MEQLSLKKFEKCIVTIHLPGEAGKTSVEQHFFELIQSNEKVLANSGGLKFWLRRSFNDGGIEASITIIKDWNGWKRVRPKTIDSSLRSDTSYFGRFVKSPKSSSLG